MCVYTRGKKYRKLIGDFMSNWLYLHSASASNPSDPNKQNASQHLYAQVQKFKQEEAALAKEEKTQSSAAPVIDDALSSEEKKSHNEKTHRKKPSSVAADETGHALAHRALLCFFLAVCRCCGLR